MTMLNLQELTEQENKLLMQVHGLIGSMNEKTQQLIQSGIFDSYRKLHNDYASLARAGNVEALKRAFFIQWYAIVEPSCFTGIPSTKPWGDGKGLDKSTETAVFDLVTQFMNSDNELQWMAAWYYQMSDHYFESFWHKLAIENLQRYIQENSPLRDKENLIYKQFENRGQMGEYFVSILESNGSRAK